MHEVIYLIFNEGFHSNNRNILIREELCGEAMRLCQMLLKKEAIRTSSSYALFALMSFHAARLQSKVSADNELFSLKEQDRKLWYMPLIILGNDAMNKAVETDEFTCYHFEAAIAAEHIKASSFQNTNWDKILLWYKKLNEIQPSPFTLLNIAMLHLLRSDFEAAHALLEEINPKSFEQRTYLST